MGEYEIRILKEDGTVALIVAEIQLADSAAIRSGKKVANGRNFEVWRGSDCIYRTGDAET